MFTERQRAHGSTTRFITQLNIYFMSFSRQTPQVQQVGKTVGNTFLTVKDVQRLIWNSRRKEETWIPVVLSLVDKECQNPLWGPGEQSMILVHAQLLSLSRVLVSHSHSMIKASWYCLRLLVVMVSLTQDYKPPNEAVVFYEPELSKDSFLHSSLSKHSESV